MFNQSRDILISGGTFTTITGDYHHHDSRATKSAGLTLLKEAISEGAMFDSAQRYPAGTCHPGTRETVIKLIMEWIEHPSAEKGVLWLYGPAGAGKSSIMQMIAELLYQKQSHFYAGTFFFARDIPERERSSVLFLTLAYQIAYYIPGMAKLVNDVMISYPSVTTKTMEVQMQLLIIGPLKALLRQPPPTHISSPIVIVDGLDECDTSVQQQGILSCIANAVSEHRVHLRFLIASRPEFRIDLSFRSAPLKDVTKMICLDDFEYESTKDIQTFLRDGFTKILDQNPDVMSGVAKPWPSTKIIEHFTAMASCQFVYASTILKFVGDYTDDFLDPKTKLDILLEPDRDERRPAFCSLDQLYKKILKVYPRKDTLKTVLGGILVQIGPTTLDILMGINKNETRMVLRAITSLINVTTETFETNGDVNLDALLSIPDPYIRYCHRSFPEFLEDERRSEEFSMKAETFSNALVDKAFDWILKGISGVPKSQGLMVYDTMWYDFLRSHIIQNQRYADKVHHHLLHLSSVINDLANGPGQFLREGMRHIRFLSYILELIKRLEQSDMPDLLIPRRIKETLAADIKSICRQSYLSHIQSLGLNSLHTMKYLPCFTFTEVSFWELGHVTTIDISGVKAFIMNNMHFLTILYQNPDFLHLDHEHHSNTAYPSYSFKAVDLNDQIFGDKFAEFLERNSLLLCSAYFEHLNELKEGKVSMYNSPGALFDTCVSIMEKAGAADPLQWKGLVDILCRYEWETPPPFCDENIFSFNLRFVNSVHGWLVRLFEQIVKNREYLGYGERVLGLIGQIYEDAILPMLQTPSFAVPLFYNCSELFLASIDIEYSRTETMTELSSMKSVEHMSSYEEPDFDMTLSCVDATYFNFFGKLTDQLLLLQTILDEETRASSTIDHTALFTLVAESFFNVLARYLYGLVHPEYAAEDYIIETYGYNPVPLQIWLENAVPSDTILNALRIMMYAWSNIPDVVEGAHIEDAWYSGVYLEPITNFLQRHNLSANDSLYLSKWIEEMYKCNKGTERGAAIAEQISEVEKIHFMDRKEGAGSVTMSASDEQKQEVVHGKGSMESKEGSLWRRFNSAKAKLLKRKGKS